MFFCGFIWAERQSDDVEKSLEAAARRLLRPKLLGGRDCRD
jgi:hypothetical protein